MLLGFKIGTNGFSDRSGLLSMQLCCRYVHRANAEICMPLTRFLRSTKDHIFGRNKSIRKDTQLFGIYDSQVIGTVSFTDQALRYRDIAKIGRWQEGAGKLQPADRSWFGAVLVTEVHMNGEDPEVYHRVPAEFRAVQT